MSTVIIGQVSAEMSTDTRSINVDRHYNFPSLQNFAKYPANVSLACDKRIQIRPNLYTWPGYEICESVDLGTSMTKHGSWNAQSNLKYYYRIRKLKKGNDPEKIGSISEIV